MNFTRLTIIVTKQKENKSFSQLWAQIKSKYISGILRTNITKIDLMKIKKRPFKTNNHSVQSDRRFNTIFERFNEIALKKWNFSWHKEVSDVLSPDMFWKHRKDWNARCFAYHSAKEVQYWYRNFDNLDSLILYKSYSKNILNTDSKQCLSLCPAEVWNCLGCFQENTLFLGGSQYWCDVHKLL